MKKKQLKDMLIRLGSSEPTLQASIFPILDHLEERELERLEEREGEEVPPVSGASQPLGTRRDYGHKESSRGRGNLT